MDRDFCADQAFFRNRPLYPNVIEVLKRLNERGYRQFTMSATFDVEAKMAYLNDILAPVSDFLIIECVRHGEFMHDTAKIDRLRLCYEKSGSTRMKPSSSTTASTTSTPRSNQGLIRCACVASSRVTCRKNLPGSPSSRMSVPSPSGSWDESLETGYRSSAGSER